MWTADFDGRRLVLQLGPRLLLLPPSPAVDDGHSWLDNGLAGVSFKVYIDGGTHNQLLTQ